MKKKGMRNVDVLNEMNRRGMGLGANINRQHITNILNGTRKLSPFMARKFEIVLGLKRFSVVEMVGFPRGGNSGELLESLDKFDKK